MIQSAKKSCKNEWKTKQACFAVREFANKSAASAASLDSVKFQAVIKSAASAASQRPNQGNQDPGEHPEAVIRQPGRCAGAPLGLVFLDLAFGEAALAADLMTA